MPVFGIWCAACTAALADLSEIFLYNNLRHTHTHTETPRIWQSTETCSYVKINFDSHIRSLHLILMIICSSTISTWRPPFSVPYFTIANTADKQMSLRNKVQGHWNLCIDSGTHLVLGLFALLKLTLNVTHNKQNKNSSNALNTWYVCEYIGIHCSWKSITVCLCMSVRNTHTILYLNYYPDV